MVADRPIVVEKMTAEDWRCLRRWLEPRAYAPEDDDDEEDDDDDFEDLTKRDLGGEQ